MTDLHSQLLTEIDGLRAGAVATVEGVITVEIDTLAAALRAVVELHRPDEPRNPICVACTRVCDSDPDAAEHYVFYPCETTTAIARLLGVEVPA